MQIVTGSENGSIGIWDLNHHEAVERIIPDELRLAVTDVDLSGNFLLASLLSGSSVIYDIRMMRAVLKTPLPDKNGRRARATRACFLGPRDCGSPLAAISATNDSVYILDSSSGTLQRKFSAHKNQSVSCFPFSTAC